MAQEQEKEPVQLTHVGVDLISGVGSLIGLRDDELVRFRFYLPPGLQQLLSLHPLTERSVNTLIEAHEAPVPSATPSAAPTPTEKSPTVVLPGRLQTKPQEGR